ncbi:GGDEF domain-containing protein [Roseateles violae]|uniref:diguanylate cyclase n=1 Tax=Roseateles violae TaxID=3058042 RepID=A0ABT8DVG7_9BURK|nr:GGDEF domain-containing protein [Pelomonas sp. PFR6]MDN3921993.1 GGDEF domain-containing protein [Pelomonas sp. PFR6]
MRYLDSRARSADHLRAALPLMTRQRSALHPVSYAVWYEHVSGRNPTLSRELQALTEAGEGLDEAQTWSLYRRHLGELDTGGAQKLSEGFSRVLDTMAASAAQAGDQTARFDSSLSSWVEQLLADPPAQTQVEVLRELLAGTREIRAAMRDLQRRLDSSQGEIGLLREEVQRARSEALIDALTGLANRRAFEQRLNECVVGGAGAAAGAAAEAPCLVLGDIDFFKKVNDSFGHSFGDHVLRAVAQTLKGVAADAALPARVGGEEFALLMPRAALPDAQKLAEAMRQSVAASRIRRGDRLQSIERVTISVGVTQLAVGESANDFFERADRALYASKRSGRNCVTVLAARAA